MPRGRKPLPTALKIVRGNPGKRPLPKGEPQPAPDLDATVPRHLDSIAAGEWRRLVCELQALKMFTALDRDVLALVCTWHSRWIRAEAKITETGGEVVTTTNGNIVVNPWCSVAARAAEALRKLLPELGLSPSSRTRLGTPTPAPAENPFAKFRHPPTRDDVEAKYFG